MTLWLELRRPAAAVKIGVVGEDRDRPAVDAGEAGDRRAAVVLADFEERAEVHDRLDDLAHLVDLAAVARDDRDELPVSARGIVGGFCAGGQFVDRGRQIGEEAPGALEGLVLARRLVVDRAVAGVDLRAAQGLLVDILAEAERTTGGPAAKSEETPATITEERDVTARAAPSPATGPRAKQTTGTAARLATT